MKIYDDADLEPIIETIRIHFADQPHMGECSFSDPTPPSTG